MKTKYLLPLAFVLLLAWPSSVTAHPHMFVDLQVEPIGTSGNTFSILWKIDPMTSELWLLEYDKNSNGKLDSKESENLFHSYLNTTYAQTIRMRAEIDGEKYTPDIKEGSAAFNNGVFEFRFLIHIDGLLFHPEVVNLELKDTSKFTAFTSVRPLTFRFPVHKPILARLEN